MKIKIPAEGLIGEAALREAVDYRQVIDAVRRAIELARQAAAQSPAWCSVVALFDDSAVVETNGGKFLQYPYTVTDAYDVTLGAPTPVVMDWRAVKMTEALESGAFAEAKAEGAAATGKFEVIAIRAGRSLNGNYYSDAALREAVPLFEKARVFVKSDEAHTKGQGKDFRDLIGQLTAPRFVEGAGADAGHVAATLELIEPEGAIGKKLAEAYQRGMQHLFGLSIDAVGKTATVLREGKKVRAATKFTRVNSVDLIVEPGAGGALVRMLEAAISDDEDDEMKLRERLFEAIKRVNAAKAAQINLDTISDEDLEAAYREAVGAPAGERVTEAALPGMAEVQAQIAQAAARAYARPTIGGCRLPAASRERLQRDFDARARFTEADVDSAIAAEREYLGKLTESGKPVLDGLDVRVEDRSVKMRDMLDAFFDPQHKDHRSVHSFKECYIEITGDKRVTGRIGDADQSRLTEALASSTWAEVLGDSIARRMVAEYNAAAYPDIRTVATVTPVFDFRTQRRTRIGGYGDLAAVAQGDAYVVATAPADEESTYAATKRGNLETVTLEAIKNDDVGSIRRIPVKLGRSARRTLAKFVFDFFRTNPTLYDSVAFFHATHANLGTTALAAAELSVHRLMMLKQAELTSTDRLGIAPRYLLVPPDLEETAWNLFKRTTNNDATFQQGWMMTPISIWYWTDTNNWYTVADPADIPTIEIGFLDGREEPELFVQDMPSVGSMFDSDKLTYKIRHIYGGAVIDYRGATGAVVA